MNMPSLIMMAVGVVGMVAYVGIFERGRNPSWATAIDIFRPRGTTHRRSPTPPGPPPESQVLCCMGGGAAAGRPQAGTKSYSTPFLAHRQALPAGTTRRWPTSLRATGTRHVPPPARRQRGHRTRGRPGVLECGHRGDRVAGVGDGEPKGERIVDGRSHSVFDELLLFETSDLPTHTVTVSAGVVSDFDALEAVFAERGYGVKPASSFQLICACRSEGSQEQARSVHAGAQQVSAAVPVDAVPGLLDIWAAAGPERSWAGLAVIG